MNRNIERYVDELLESSTPERPAWNLEQILQGKKPSWNYIDGCMITAILELHAITGDHRYLEFADGFIDHYVDDDGTIWDYSVDEYNLDNINEGKVLFRLYDLTGREKYRRGIDTLMRQVETHPRTEEGSFWHKAIYPHQVWLDGLYMVQPFYLEYELRYNDGENLGDIVSQFETVRRRMRDPVTGLYYHGYDASRKMFWCDKDTGLSPTFWIRAVGWFFMALVDCLEILRPHGEAAEPLERMFRDLAADLLRYQDPGGMWYQVVDQGDRAGNYLETSGSSILSYAYLKAVRLGLLEEPYRVVGTRAFQGICDRFLTEKEGRMSLGGICLVAGLGGKERRDGSFEYYLSEPVVANEAKGVAPFLLAYTEVLRLGA